MPKGIPDPKADVDALFKTVQALKEQVELLTGVRTGQNERSVSVADFAGAATFAELRDRLTGFSTPDAQNSHPDWAVAADVTAALVPLQADIDAAEAAIAALVIPDAVQADFISGLIPVPTNTDYRIVVKAPYAMTITETTTVCTSGTATATFKINTTALGGTANSVSSTEQSQAHASANAVAAGDDIVITISSNATCLNLSFTIAYTRTLAV